MLIVSGIILMVLSIVGHCGACSGSKGALTVVRTNGCSFVSATCLRIHIYSSLDRYEHGPFHANLQEVAPRLDCFILLSVGR